MIFIISTSLITTWTTSLCHSQKTYGPFISRYASTTKVYPTAPWKTKTNRRKSGYKKLFIMACRHIAIFFYLPFFFHFHCQSEYKAFVHSWPYADLFLITLVFIFILCQSIMHLGAHELPLKNNWKYCLLMKCVRIRNRKEKEENKNLIWFPAFRGKMSILAF